MFKQTIDLLVEQLDGYRKSFTSDGDELRSAVKLLEAAEKVDKRRCLNVLRVVAEHIPGDVDRMLYSILTAIPE